MVWIEWCYQAGQLQYNKNKVVHVDVGINDHWGCHLGTGTKRAPLVLGCVNQSKISHPFFSTAECFKAFEGAYLKLLTKIVSFWLKPFISPTPPQICVRILFCRIKDKVLYKRWLSGGLGNWNKRIPTETQNLETKSCC